MSIWNNVKNMFREKAEKIEAATADHVRDGKFAIKDAEAEEIRFRASVRDVVADLKQMETRLTTIQADRKKYDGLAKKFAAAVEDGDKDQMTNLETAAGKVDALDAEITATKKSLDGLRNSRQQLQVELDKVRNKIARAKQTYSVNAARIKAAKIKDTLNQSKARVAAGVSGLGALDDMSAAADRMEAEAEATEELAGPAADIESLEEAADAIGGSSAADRYLKG
jgi:phage shock protein A